MMAPIHRFWCGSAFALLMSVSVGLMGVARGGAAQTPHEVGQLQGKSAMHSEIAAPKPGHEAQPVTLAQMQAQAEALAQKLAAGSNAAKLVEIQAFGPGFVQHWQLPNGLQIAIAADADAPLVAVHTWVRVGSAYETAGKTGLAHLMEHLMFKATRTRAGGVFDRVLEQVGASANAATFLDWTYYHETVPPPHLATVLEMEADRMVNLDLTAAAFKAELEVVKNERREHVENDADGLLDEALADAAFAGHPYGHPVIGTAADLEKLNLQDVQGFYRQHYGPSRAMLVLVGAVDAQVALEAIAKFYGPIAANSKAIAAPHGKAAADTVHRVVSVEGQASRLLVAWRTVPGDHTDAAALQVLAETLFNADSARIQRALLYDAKVAAHVSGHVSDAQLGNLFDVRMAMLPGKTAHDGLAALDAATLALLSDKPLTDDEVAAAKNRLKMQHYRELTGVDGRAEALGHAWATFGSLGHHAKVWQAVAQTSAADVRRVAKTYLIDKRITVVSEPPTEKTVQKQRKTKAKVQT